MNYPNERYESAEQEIEHLNELIFELGENLKAAQDQNHYFVLMGEYRDKAYTYEKAANEWMTAHVRRQYDEENCIGEFLRRSRPDDKRRMIINRMMN